MRKKERNRSGSGSRSKDRVYSSENGIGNSSSSGCDEENIDVKVKMKMKKKKSHSKTEKKIKKSKKDKKSSKHHRKEKKRYGKSHKQNENEEDNAWRMDFPLIKKVEKNIPHNLDESNKSNRIMSNSSDVNPSNLITSKDQKNYMPMTLADHIKESSTIREVYDPLSGRTRLIRGSGEIIERIVSKKEQSRINQLATKTDGVLYQHFSGLNH